MPIMRTLKRAAIPPIAVIWFTHDLALVAYRFGKRDASGMQAEQIAAAESGRCA
jgi:hypothetical protein